MHLVALGFEAEAGDQVAVDVEGDVVDEAIAVVVNDGFADQVERAERNQVVDVEQAGAEENLGMACAAERNRKAA